MKVLIRFFAICSLLAVAAAANAEVPGVEPASDGSGKPPSPDKATGVSIFGEYLMRHTVDTDGTATAQFEPSLPTDNALLLNAMKALARVAYGQHGIDVADVDAFRPVIGKVIKLEDWDYEYRFLLEDVASKGVRLILVQRRQIQRPSTGLPPTPGPAAP